MNRMNGVQALADDYTERRAENARLKKQIASLVAQLQLTEARLAEAEAEVAAYRDGGWPTVSRERSTAQERSEGGRA